jgi:uncharacterized membrane protein
MHRPLSKSFAAAGLAAALALAAPASATYVFNTVDYPGAVFTDVRGIDNTGRIVGYASFDGVNNFSFTYAGGVFTPLPVAALSVSALGMNDLGAIVGSAGPIPSAQGFIFNGGTYTYVSRPGWPQTEFRGIGNGGTVTGRSYDDTAGTSDGFLYDPVGGLFTPIPVAGSTLVFAQGINDAGQVVGSARFNPGGNFGFLRETDGSVHTFQVGGASTSARGINNSGVIAGFAVDPATLVTQAFVGTSAGFELIGVPGAALTAGEAINDAGQVSGLWDDGSGTTHGFIATPAAMPTGTTAGGAYTFGVDVVPDVPIFIDPPVAVGYDYAIGKRDPRIAKVQLPIGIGDSLYLVKAGGGKWVVAGGEWFDFRAHGYPNGVTDFRVSCIETSSGLDPANPQAFPTGLTFVSAGRFTGTQKPRTRDSHAHQGASCLKGDDD